MAQQRWVILVSREDDGSWAVHIPEINLDRQIEHERLIKRRARQLIESTTGADHNKITVRFHNVSPANTIGDGGEPQ